jgi:hypothetical protein
MRRLLFLAAAWVLGIAMAQAQGIAPGGPVYNSTGIGSGLGNVPGGTGPSFPNGTTAPALPRPIPPGGLPPVGRIDTTPSLAPSPSPGSLMSKYPRQPLDPYPLPASHRKIVADPDVGKDATDRGKADGTPASTL